MNQKQKFDGAMRLMTSFNACYYYSHNIGDDSKKIEYCFKFAKHVLDYLHPSSVAKIYQ